ncbi:Hsp33 family molecular chaperone HslO [Priestia filamentosa]|uniref:Hsp33 family molecular chaperone HslO n=1 Tax=Priestia filamentosa TaxID=1402861 RepID=UPI00397C53CE
MKTAGGINGILFVTKDISLIHLFIGQVPIISEEIGEDFASYLLHSEQVPASFGLGVLGNPDLIIRVADGFII